MSQNNKLSFWQKLKRLLTSPAPQSVCSNEAQTSEAVLGNKKSHSREKNRDEKPKISLVKSRSTTPIVDTIEQFLQSKQWHYTYYRPRADDTQQSHHLSLRMRNGRLDCGYLFCIQEKNALLAVYGILPFVIPESHHSAAMLLITQINYDMIIGNLEMDVNDGEIRFKSAIDVEAVGINDTIIEQLLQSVVAMTTVSFEIFDDLLNFENPSEDMPTLLLELRQQSDARTFYLPTQFVQ